MAVEQLGQGQNVFFNLREMWHLLQTLSPLKGGALVNLKAISPGEIIERFRVTFTANDKG